MHASALITHDTPHPAHVLHAVQPAAMRHEPWPTTWLGYLQAAEPGTLEGLHTAVLVLRPFHLQRQHPLDARTHGLRELRLLLSYGRGTEGADRQRRLMAELQRGQLYRITCTRTWHDRADAALCLLGDTTICRMSAGDLLRAVG